MSTKPKVLLFDIGGVCVLSPFQAILDYEKSNNIPLGWINTAISASGKSGSWSQLERGLIPLDSSFFKSFTSDLRNESLWRKFYISHLSKTRNESSSDAAEEALFQVPEPPAIDSETLFWDMMKVSRNMDPFMFPALKKLRKMADEEKSFLIGALSNTSIFPEGHEYNDTTTEAGKQHAELKNLFDVFVSSAHVGMRKPDREIYEFAIGKLDEVAKGKGLGGVVARDVMFLDDIGANLRGAREIGMRTLKVQLGRVDEAVDELERVMGVRLSGRDAKL